MLVWSRSGRILLWTIAALVFGVLFLCPLAVIFLSSIADQWNGLLPSGFTLEHYRDVVSGSSAEAVKASLVTGFLASLLALVSGTWAALALRPQGETMRRLLGTLFFIPSAVPSVSVGLGLLVAFSQPPLLLNGTVAIVMIAHFILISAFTFGNVSAGLSRLSPDYEQVASSLGAKPAYRLRHVTLPLISPAIVGGFLFAATLSFDNITATLFWKKPGIETVPTKIFAMLRTSISPEINARGAVMSVITILLPLAGGYVVRRLTRGR